MARTATSETLWTHVYEALRHEILSGVHAPGTRLKPVELRERFGVSISVLREALARLVEQKLVKAQHNQGFRVIDLTEKGLRELTDLRILIEGHAVRRSIELGNVAWESNVVAAHHALTKTPARSPKTPHSSTDAWSEAHRAFHMALAGACEMPMLIEMCNTLYDASELYRRLSVPSGDLAKRNAAREHREICEAALARDADLAVARLTRHFELTTKLLMRSLNAVPVQSVRAKKRVKQSSSAVAGAPRR